MLSIEGHRVVRMSGAITELHVTLKRACRCSVVHIGPVTAASWTRRPARVASRRVSKNSLAQGVYLLCTLARPFPRRFISRPRKPRRCAAGFIIRFNSALEGYWSVQTWSVMRAAEKSPPSLSLSFFPHSGPFHFTFRDRSKNLICRERTAAAPFPLPPSSPSLSFCYQ